MVDWLVALGYGAEGHGFESLFSQLATGRLSVNQAVNRHLFQRRAGKGEGWSSPFHMLYAGYGGLQTCTALQPHGYGEALHEHVHCFIHYFYLLSAISFFFLSSSSAKVTGKMQEDSKLIFSDFGY